MQQLGTFEVLLRGDLDELDILSLSRWGLAS